jgi:hypothetical protein
MTAFLVLFFGAVSDYQIRQIGDSRPVGAIRHPSPYQKSQAIIAAAHAATGPKITMSQNSRSARLPHECMSFNIQQM